MKVQAIDADITTLEVDTIVNASNNAMMIGGGLDGAIHRAAGQELINYNAQHHGLGCHTGKVRRTPGFNLPAKWIFHTVGPDMREYGQELGDALLTSCYIEIMTRAIAEKVPSIAIPAISTGIFGFDKVRAAKIATETVLSYHEDAPDMDVIFACFGEEDTAIVNAALERVDAEIHHITWSIGAYPDDDPDGDHIDDLSTDAPDGVYNVIHNYVYGGGEDTGEAVGVTVKDGKFVLAPTLRACAIARNKSGYWGHFLEALTFFPEDDTDAFFEAQFGS